jgi:transcriptional regulator with XRE-family HTH domain
MPHHSSQHVADIWPPGEQRRISQSALAMRVGVSASHLNRVLRGRARPSPALLRRLRDELEKPLRRRGSPIGVPVEKPTE